jgi:hypothetical protein
MGGQKGAADRGFSIVTAQEWEGSVAVPAVERATGAPAIGPIVRVRPEDSEEGPWQANRCRSGSGTTAARRTPPTSAAG